LILIAFAILFVLIRIPLTEGRAQNLDLFHIYADPLIIYGYISTIVFFIGWYQVFSLLNLSRINQYNSTNALPAWKRLNKAALLLCLLIVLAGIYIRIFHAKEDDPAGFLGLCFITSLFSIGIAFIASKQAKRLAAPADRQSS